MTESKKAVFLSYASQDAEAARHIADALRSAGIEVWFDQSELRGGDVWDQRIREQIRDCALFVPIISANTALRHEGYFRLEWDLADQRTHMIARNRAFIVPVCLDATPDAGADVPQSFLRVQWTRLLAGDTPPAFVERVSRLLFPETAHASAEVRSAAAAVPHTAAALGHAAASPAAFRLAKPVLLLIAGVAAVGVGYFAVEKFVLSKRVAAGTQTSTGEGGAPAQNAIPEKSIAVLPFADMSEKHDQEYFADGMAEEILNLLVKIPELKVIGRTSSFQFKGKTDDLRKIGTTLGAAYVVEGSVRRSGDHIRVTSQLIGARDGSQLWSETFDRNTSDILRLQEEVAANIAHSLNLTVSGNVSQRAAVTSPQAYDYYLRGLRDVGVETKESIERALADFQKALVLDPNFAQAAVGVATAHLHACFDGLVEPRIACERARTAVDAVVKLDPKSADAYAIRAELRTVYDWDWNGAVADVKKAEELGGGEFTSFAAAKLACAASDMPRASQLLESIIARNPLDPTAQSDMGVFVDLRSGRYSEAEVFIQRALDITPQSATDHFQLGLALLMQGKLDKALASMKRETDENTQLEGLAVVYHAMGRKVESDAALKAAIERTGGMFQSDIARVHAFRGELEKAMDCLERAYVAHDIDLYYIKGDPLLKNLEGDPRYKAFLRKMNLPE